jgi:outer membrane protein OmpA-like peptidoglycan-associated protein
MFPKQLLTKIAISSLLVLTGSLLSPASAAEVRSYIEGTDQAAVVFDPLQVNNFEMAMSDSDFNKLTYPNVTNDNEGPWLSTVMKFTMAYKVYGPYTVGVHLKGAWGSWRDVNGKAGFKIKMDAFVKNQKLFGITKFTLNNMVQDGSYIHEALTYRLFRGVGVPTPRVGYANVTLNGRNYGLHLNVETIDTTMINRWGLENKHLYKGGVPYFPDFYAGYEQYFQVEDGSTTSKADLTKFIRANQFTGDVWWNAITEIADMEEITLDFATEAYVGHWDGYPYNHNNFFITFDSVGYAHMIPWGTDQTWGGQMDYFGSGTLLFQRCQGSDDCREMYLQSLAKVARTAKALDLGVMAEDVAAAIRSDIIADPWGPGIDSASSNQSWTIWNVNNQQAVLAGMTSAWDTGVQKVLVADKEYVVTDTAVLPAGTKTIEVQAIPFQPGATSDVAEIADLTSGINYAEVIVTSANGQHTGSAAVPIYVLTKRSASAQVAFNSNSSTFSKTGYTKLAQLRFKLKKSVGLALTFTMPNSRTAKALLDKRASAVVNHLRAAGIKVSKFTKKLVAKGNPSELAITMQYQN